MTELTQIRNFLVLNDRLATSGMPRPEQFAAIRQAGYEVVINLALPTSDNAIPNEGELVSALGMTYVHIPVNFEAPQPDDFEKFSRMLDACKARKVFVHCAANMRVSAFIFLHRLKTNTVPRNEAERDLLKIWNPDGIWRDFVNQHLVRFGQAPLK